MLFQAPELDEREQEVLAQIGELRNALRFQLSEPRRWSGSLRRLSFARNIRGSNSIEGFDAALDDAAAAALGEEPLDASTETRLALEGYRSAMTYVLQLAQEPDQIEINEHLLKSLHFMMTSYDLKNRPGRWRAGAIYVRDERTGENVHEGADVSAVPKLMREVASQASEKPPNESAIVRAAMAHLNLVMIHPFRDGNGRMARCLQSLVLASDGELAPIFNSIEEYLGRNTQAYYDVLAEVGGGNWSPARDARPWVRFVLTAHLRQAKTLQHRVRSSELLWMELEKLSTQHKLPERTMPALFDAAYGFRLRRGTYIATLAQMDEAITDQTASRDFKAMVDAGLLQPFGEKRGRYYTAGDSVLSIRQRVRPTTPRDDTDPFS